ITPEQLDPEARSQLNSLPNDLADIVARYLVAAGLADDPEQGYAYAHAAKRLAARVGVVREACGIAAYRTGRWAEALSEFLAARVPELTSSRLRPWSARLFYAYADALLAAGRADEARDAFARAVEADPDGETDAADRLDQLDGIEFDDLEDDDLEGDLDDDG